MALVPDSKITLAAAASTMQAHFGGLSHPLFTQQQTPLNPDRPLDEVTKPVPRHHERLQHLLQTATPAPQAIASHLQAQTLAKYHHANVAANANVAAKGSANPKAKMLQHSEHSVDETRKFQHASPWALIASPDLASHLELLEAGGLIALPPQFFEPVAGSAPVVGNEVAASAVAPTVATASSARAEAAVMATVNATLFANLPTSPSAHPAAPSRSDAATAATDRTRAPALPVSKARPSKALLLPLIDMVLLDLSDIHPVCLQHSALTRYCFKPTAVADEHPTPVAKQGASRQTLNGQSLAAAIPEMLNDIFSPNWEVILYPDRFDNGVDSLAIDRLACSVAVHILKQCPTRQTVNRSLTAQQICQHMRSYVLSQCNLHPQYESTYRQIRLFAGHVVFAAAYLGLKVAYNPRALLSVEEAQQQGTADSRLGQPIYTNVAARAALFTRYPNLSRYYINGWF